MKRWMILLSSLAATVILALATAIVFGGPKDIATLDSINQPFVNVDYSRVPPAKSFQARDGAALAQALWWVFHQAGGELRFAARIPH